MKDSKRSTAAGRNEQADALSRYRSEGELNISPLRQAWHDEQLDQETRDWLAEDAKYFLHQSLSTPCLDVLAGSKGSYLEDLQGKRFLDFHGNNVHQVGFGHPRVVQAIREQMETLPFCPRRYTNIPAIKLARKLTALAPGDLNKVLFAPGGSTAIGMALKLARLTNQTTPDGPMKHRLQHLLKQLPNGKWVNKHDARVSYYWEPANRWDELPKVTAPVLIVRGGKSLVLQDKTIDDMLAAFPNAQAITIEEAGHTVPEDRAEEFIAAIEPFLAS